MKRLTLLLLLSAQAFALDSSLIKKSVVKIVSTLQGVSAEFHGSGLLFEKGGKRYVLTSDHVVGHVNGGMASGSHSATSSETGETLDLSFLGAEWGNGLALMEVLNDKHPENAVPYAELLKVPSAKVGDRVSFYGYPYESPDLTEETFAKLRDYSAQMPYFVFSRALVEMEASVGEFGMSGGAAFTQSGEFLGVLAYQRILEDSTTSVDQNRVYAIPRATAIAWVEDYFKQGAKYMPFFSEPWFAQGDPRQLLVTNNGLLLMYRIFKGHYRFGIGRMEHLLILKDGPTHPYSDKRGFMKVLQQFMKDNPWRPSEFGLIDRSSGKPLLREVLYPAQVLTGFDEPNYSIFLILGEQHADRYKRVKPLADLLEQAVAALNAKVKGSSEWGAVYSELSSLVGKLNAMPAMPSDPGTPGANEFYSIDWMTDVVFQMEAISKHSGWKAIEKAASVEAAAVKKAQADLLDGFKVSEQTP